MLCARRLRGRGVRVIAVIDDGAVRGVRVVGAVAREVEVRQQLDADQPEQARHQREAAACAAICATPGHEPRYYVRAAATDRVR